GARRALPRRQWLSAVRAPLRRLGPLPRSPHDRDRNLRGRSAAAPQRDLARRRDVRRRAARRRAEGSAMTGRGPGRKRAIVVADRADRLPYEHAVEASTYLAGQLGTEDPGISVINLCRSDRYLSQGYYVSLLADARAQHVMPSIDTLEALSSIPEALRLLEDAGVPTFHGSGADRRRTLTRLAGAGSPEIVDELSIFGRCARKDLARLASRIHQRFPVPACRLSFAKINGAYQLFHLEALPLEKLEAEARDQ